MTQHSVLTIATGGVFYQRLAITLVRSFARSNAGNGIAFRLVTDRPDMLPAAVRDRVEVLPVAPGQLGPGFSPKLHLDRLAPDGVTLFVDADCLCVGSLEPVFARFMGRSVSVVGTTVLDGEWFGDISCVRERLGIGAMPKFNGGLYYVEKGPEATAIFHTARELEAQYDALGLVRLRGFPNDELLLSLAMAIHGATPVADDGSILADPQAFPGRTTVDLLRGHAHLDNPPPPDPAHCAWNPLREARPRIVHFLGSSTDGAAYQREAFMLALLDRGSPEAVARALAYLGREAPIETWRQVKDLLRPLLHRVLGPRRVRASARTAGEA